MLLNPQEIALPLVLKQAGYTTAIIGKNHAFLMGDNIYPDAPYGEKANREYDELSRHFDYIFQGNHVSVDGMHEDKELLESIQWAKKNSWGQQHNFGVNPYPAEKSITYTLAENASKYIQNSDENPFYMWLSFPDPHTPYQVSEPYASLYNPEDVPAPIKDNLEGKPEIQKIAHYLDYNHLYDEKHFKALRAIHYGMINQIDDNLGKVIKALEDKGILENTIIAFVSDHGDSMGDHGIIQKHSFFYDSFTHVPFIISWKGKLKTGRTDNLVELVDLMPTLLELAGMDRVTGVQGKGFAPFLKGEEYSEKEYIVIESGENILPLCLGDIRDEEGQLIEKGTAFAWCAFREAWAGKNKCIRTKKWKLCIYSTGEGELYNLVENPDETNNLFNDPNYEVIKNELTMKLLLWCFNNEDTLPINTTVADRMHYKKRIPLV